MVQVNVRMLRRLAILLLVTMTMGVGVTVCPRTVSACAMSVQARHACCDHAALRTDRCCCSEGQQATPLLQNLMAPQSDHAQHVLAAAGWVPSVAATWRATSCQALARSSQAPPDTPLRNHTQLLL